MTERRRIAMLAAFSFRRVGQNRGHYSKKTRTKRRRKAVQASPSVLIVDASEENREVLETALTRRGIRTLSASRAARGAEMVRSHQPDLIVLDLEVNRASPEELCSRFSAAAVSESPRMVLLGTMRKEASTASREIVAKPYHYGPLIRRIEEILGTVEQGSRRVA